jgi:F0F1-type ATP synthase membrane subunit b/b'
MFLSLDGTFWFQLLNFAIFFAILNVVFLRPVGEAIKERRAYIDGVHADFERYEREAKALDAEAAQKVATARRQADETVARTRAQADAEAATLVAARTQSAQEIADLARTRVAAETAAVTGREDHLSQGLAKLLLARAIGAPS